MIARFHILLPYQLEVPVDLDLEPIRKTIEDYEVVIHPLYQTIANSEDAEGTSPVPALDVIDNLFPNSNPNVSETVLIDDRPTLRVNAIKVDFIKSSLNRNQNQPDEPDETEPPIDFVFQIINSFLTVLRIVAQIRIIKPIDQHNTYWRLDYMTDDGLYLAEEEGKIRGKFLTSFEWEAHIIFEPVWEKVDELFPVYQTTSWDMLLLDAQKVLPEVGPAIVLTHTVLETFILFALEHLAVKADVHKEIWKWIYHRNPFIKNPSTDEQYDDLLKYLTGQSLKEKVDLWEAYRNIKKIRNGFVHEGKLFLGDTPVNSHLASQLINKAKKIIEWIEQFLSEELRRPKAAQYAQVHFTKIIRSGDEEEQ